MNNFPRPHAYNTYNTNNINDIKDNNPIVLRQDFHNKEITAPIPAIPKIPLYPPAWDKKKTKLPSVLPNNYYAVACIVFTSIIVVMAMIAIIFKVAWMLFTK